eukprot:CAMPEP_0198138272 /NCGR_PEP_ID=MMETSP1443-20131203/1695_1 /TAXON_ID=186043 /ORGANISM="Entomoneis sp., Strain CCMP2396" /LENGTH=333 /DNA_ID=CAMNT_0043799983 /DNA_START=271 /DNA_END=1272 /DNA_ORIENTATION=+
MTAYLFGFGLFVPFWILVPPAVVQSLQIQNKMFTFCLSVIPSTTSFFRTTEAIFGFTPKHAQKSVASFALYYGSPMLLQWDEKSQKHIKATVTQTMGHLKTFTIYLFITGFYQSMFGVVSFFPRFAQATPADWHSIANIANVAIWKDTFLIGLLFQLYLTTLGEGLRFATSVLTGFKTQPLMDNPFFSSTSVSDFWGRKWNLLVHACLKNGVYKPVRLCGGSALAGVLSSFLASGLLHEWILFMIFPQQENQPRPFGATTAFFVWQAGLISLEYTSTGQAFWKNINKTCHPLIPALIVVLAGVPLGHWFTNMYVHSDFYVNAHLLLVAVKPIS